MGGGGGVTHFGGRGMQIFLKTTVHETFLHPCTDCVTPAKSHLHTPTRMHIKSQLNLTLEITKRSLSETVLTSPL